MKRKNFLQSLAYAAMAGSLSGCRKIIFEDEYVVNDKEGRSLLIPRENKGTSLRGGSRWWYIL